MTLLKFQEGVEKLYLPNLILPQIETTSTFVEPEKCGYDVDPAPVLKQIF